MGSAKGISKDRRYAGLSDEEKLAAACEAIYDSYDEYLRERRGDPRNLLCGAHARVLAVPYLDMGVHNDEQGIAIMAAYDCVGTCDEDFAGTVPDVHVRIAMLPSLHGMFGGVQSSERACSWGRSPGCAAGHIADAVYALVTGTSLDLSFVHGKREATAQEGMSTFLWEPIASSLAECRRHDAMEADVAVDWQRAHMELRHGY